MERLTRRMCGGYGMAPGHELNTVRGMREAVDRLAAYEDLGFDPSEIKTAIGIVEVLAKTEYPHNFQREAPWIVDFCKKITTIQKIAKLWVVETVRKREEGDDGTEET